MHRQVRSLKHKQKRWWWISEFIDSWWKGELSSGSDASYRRRMSAVPNARPSAKSLGIHSLANQQRHARVRLRSLIWSRTIVRSNATCRAKIPASTSTSFDRQGVMCKQTNHLLDHRYLIYVGRHYFFPRIARAGLELSGRRNLLIGFLGIWVTSTSDCGGTTLTKLGQSLLLY